MSGAVHKATGGWRGAIVAFAMLSLAACAAPRPPEASLSANEINDPNESLNRAIFAFNEGLDVAILRPMAVWYRFLVPFPGVRDTIRRVIDNAALPWTMVNELLQGEGGRAGVTSARFLINTTLGLGGTIDWATRWGYPHHSEDFGLTLARRFGVREGPYAVMVGVGPRTMRDAITVWVDVVGNPIGWLLPFDAIDMRSRHLEDVERLRRESVDLYATARSIWLQHRRAEVSGGGTRPEDVPRVAPDPDVPRPPSPDEGADIAAPSPAVAGGPAAERALAAPPRPTRRGGPARQPRAARAAARPPAVPQGVAPAEVAPAEASRQAGAPSPPPGASAR